MTATDYPISYKFNRANKHLQDLYRTIMRFLKGNANGVINDFTTEPGCLIVRAYSRSKPPPSCSGLIGEVLYHYRAALDYFACELARYNDKVVDDHVEFPIFLERDKFRNLITGELTHGIVKRIGLLRDDHQAIIEDEQPFNRRHGEPDDDPLWLLYCLSNFDRHQFIHLTSTVVNTSVHNFTPREAAARFEQVSVSYGAFEREAEVARFRILAGPSTLQMEVNSNVRFNVAFDDKGPGAGRPVLATLGGIGVRAGNLVQRFLPLS